MTVTVFYDSRCPLCDREIQFYKTRYPTANITWADLHHIDSPESLPASTTEMLKVIHVIDESGTLLKGVDGFTAMWLQLSLPWRMLATLIALPLINHVARFAYNRFATRRYAKLYCTIETPHGRSDP